MNESRQLDLFIDAPPPEPPTPRPPARSEPRASRSDATVPTVRPQSLASGTRWREVRASTQSIGFVLKRSRRKSIGLTINDDGLLVTAPNWVTLAQIDEVMAVEKRSKGKLMPVFQYRFGNGIQQAKAIIDAGLAGKPFVGTVETLWRREAEYYAVPWRGKWKTELGGVLMGHAIHPHDMFCYLMGPLKSLYGRVATRVNPIEVEDCISASVELESGALGSFTASLGSADEITRLRLVFDNLTIESDHAPYNPGAAPWKILPRNEGTKSAIADLLKDWQDVPPRFTTQMARFHDALLGRGPLPVTTEDSRRALEIVTAFYYSSLTHQEVVFPIGTDHPKYKSWLPEGFA